MSEVTVRDARRADAPVVGGLLDELGYPVAADEVAARIAAFAASSRDLVLVAVVDGEVVGVVSANLVPAFAEGGHHATLSTLSVAAAARRRGVGRALVVEAERRAYDAGARIVQVSSGRRPERGGAHRFYPALGYTDAARDHVRYQKLLLERPARA